MKKFTLVSLLLAVVCWIVSAATLISFGEKGFENISQEIVGRKLIEFQTKTEDLDPQQVQAIEEIEIISPSSSIEVLAAEDNGLHVEYPGVEKGSMQGRPDGKKIRYDFTHYFEGSENKFMVKIFNGNGLIHISDMNASKIVFRVPKNIKTIKVKTQSGDLKVASVNGATLKFETQSGNLKVKKSNFSKVDGSSVSGDLRIQGYAQNMDLKTVSGEVRIQSENKSPQLLASTTSGDISIDFSEPPNSKLSFESNSGEISVNTEGKVVEERKKDHVFKLGNGDGDIKLKTVSGDAKVRSLSGVF